MITVVINNKSYVVPEIDFGAIRSLESHGYSIMKLADFKNYAFAALNSFTCFVAKVDEDEADRLLQQHLLGGGSFDSIFEAFGKALDESDFFNKLVEQMKNQGEKPKKNTKASQH